MDNDNEKREEHIMAHALDVKNGKHAFYSLRKSAWHNLGQVVNAPCTSDKILELACMDWEVEKVPLYSQAPIAMGDNMLEAMLSAPTYTAIDSHVMTRRTDTGANLGVVGANWTAVQNRQLFDWVNALGKWGEMTVETAGVLNGGRNVWVMIRMDSLDFGLDSKDIIRPYLLLSNGHDGSQALTIAPTTTRVVCANTLRMAHMEIDKKGKAATTGHLSGGWRFVHASDIERRMKAAGEMLAGTTELWKSTQIEMQRLCDKVFDEAVLDRILDKVWIDGDDDDRANNPDEKKKLSKVATDRNAAVHSLLHAPTNTTPAAKGTCWGALNAITEYLDHDVPFKDKDTNDDPETRFRSAHFGKADHYKAKAYETVYTYATTGKVA